MGPREVEKNVMSVRHFDAEKAKIFSDHSLHMKTQEIRKIMSKETMVMV